MLLKQPSGKTMHVMMGAGTLSERVEAARLPKFVSLASSFWNNRYEDATRGLLASLLGTRSY